MAWKTGKIIKLSFTPMEKTEGPGRNGKGMRTFNFNFACVRFGLDEKYSGSDVRYDTELRKGVQARDIKLGKIPWLS